MHQENLIQRGDLLQRLTRGLEIKGVKSAALTLDPTVPAVVILEDLTKQSEFQSPKDRSAGAGFTVPAVAGELGGIALVNPADSGVILILDRCVVSPPTAQVFNLSEMSAVTVAATYGAIASGLWLDKRNDGFPTAQLFQGSDPATITTAPGPIETQRIGASGPFPFWPETGGIVIRSGRAVAVECLAANAAFNASFRWREISEP